MANFDVQAFFDSLNVNARWGVPAVIQRTNALPVDLTEVFATKAEAEAYAADTAQKAYPGQIIRVIDKDTGKNSYFGISQTRTLEEIGGAVDVDDKTIALGSDGKLSLKNFGVKYWRYVAPTTQSETGQYVETDWNDATNPAPSGLEVKIVTVAEGQYELAYYQPNPTTIEGVAGEIADIKSQIANMYTKNDLYNKTEIDQKLDDIPSWETISE